jgi:hypothetical protein
MERYICQQRESAVRRHSDNAKIIKSSQSNVSMKLNCHMDGRSPCSENETISSPWKWQ